MAVLQFVCFILLVVACISVCSYYNARIEELEEEVEKLHINKADEDLFVDIVRDFKGDIVRDFKDDLEHLQGRIDYLYDQVESLDLFDTELDKNMKTYSYLKILEIEAINSKVNDKDLVVLEQIKKDLLEDIE